jgi:catechol 2,3-dioxygenase-like lactoylglutathione lyase family enzyme
MLLGDAMTEPKLSYVALISRDVAGASRLLGDVLGLRRSVCATEDGDVPVFAAGRAALALFAPGDRFVGETAGVRVFLASPLEIARDGGSLIERIDHLGIASADNRAAIALFNGRLGLPVESQQTDVEVETALESFSSDKYGVVYHSRAPRVVGGLRVAFLTAGDCELEFLQNFDPSHGTELGHGTAGTTRQDQGAITRFIATQGAGLHHVALKTPDIDGALAALERAGARMIDRIGRPGSRRARIGFVHPSSFGGVLFHLVQRDQV